MESICNYFIEYKNAERQIRDFIDLDSTYRSINGEQDDFSEISLKEDNIFQQNNVLCLRPVAIWPKHELDPGKLPASPSPPDNF